MSNTSVRSTSLILLSCFLLFSSATASFNITKLLARYDGYGTFNNLLTQTKLASDINSRITITVLAIQDGNIGDLAGKPIDVQKAILSSHVVLDYYDTVKLRGLKKGTTLTTLFQASGIAENKQGFLNVSSLPNGNVAFGSAMNGGVDVILKEAVAAQPYNISVLQVSGPIVAPGLDPAMTAQAAGAPKQSAALPPGPLTKGKKKPAAAPGPDAADAPTEDAEVADAPSPDAEAPADSPASAPADAPEADAPTADDDAAEKEENAKSSVGKGFISNASLLVVMMVSVFAAL